MKFRKKPVVIEAVQWTGRNWQEVLDFCTVPDEVCGGVPAIFITNDVANVGGGRRPVLIETLEGTMRGEVGDWIIKGVAGEFYPCKPDIFKRTYEPVEVNL